MKSRQLWRFFPPSRSHPINLDIGLVLKSATLFTTKRCILFILGFNFELSNISKQIDSWFRSLRMISQ